MNKTTSEILATYEEFLARNTHPSIKAWAEQLIAIKTRQLINKDRR